MSSWRVASILAACSLAGCLPVSKFKTEDQARGTVLVADYILLMQPLCQPKVSYMKFDLDKARRETADAVQFLKSKGETEEKITSLRNRTDSMAEEMGSWFAKSPDQATALCVGIWRDADNQHFKTHEDGGTDGSPPPVSEAELKAQDDAEAKDKAERKAIIDAANDDAQAAAKDAEEAARKAAEYARAAGGN